MTERLIISASPGDKRQFYARARFANAEVAPKVADFEESLTEVGKSLYALLNMVDGADVWFVNRHHVTIGLAHAALWSWEEVEPRVIDAFTQALLLRPGETFEIIREGTA